MSHCRMKLMGQAISASNELVISNVLGSQIAAYGVLRRKYHKHSFWGSVYGLN